MFLETNSVGCKFCESASVPEVSGSISILSNDMINAIFFYLGEVDLNHCWRVSKEWRILSNGEVNRKFYPQYTFGKVQWETYIGTVEEEPPLPEDINEILKSDCPYWKEKKVYETHMLVLMPKTVNNLPFTLDFLEKLVKTPLRGRTQSFYFKPPMLEREHGATSINESYWVLITKNLLDGSRNKTRDEQLILAAGVSGYRAPTLLETATCILMKLVSLRASENEFFFLNPCSRTCCQEQTMGLKLALGGGPSTGLIFDHYGDSSNVGVAALRKL
jgi:hypothetical protein